MTSTNTISKPSFLFAVFLITVSMLIFQISQTRILSAIAWYSLAFFAISVAMLGATVGAVWVYLSRERFQSSSLTVALCTFALATAVAMPASLTVQFCLVTTLSLSLTTVVSWFLLVIVMAGPYVFSGVVISLALTRSPFSTGVVYGVDLLGAATGCVVVVLILNVLDGPTTIVVAGAISGLSALSFAASADSEDKQLLKAMYWWRRPAPVVIGLIGLALLNSSAPVGIRPILVKDKIEKSGLGMYERWNSYSRVLAWSAGILPPPLFGASLKLPADTRVPQIVMNIDGDASTFMFHYDGTVNSISFLRYDLVNLAYYLPGIRKSAVIGVGGGRDLMSAYLFGVSDITGVELNPIFIDMHTRNPLYSTFSNLIRLPNVRLHVDDARSWFASTKEKFDLVQMSMIDTWAATGAGAFSLSENGLYTLEGWRTFLNSIDDGGVFTASRWYDPGDVNETGRMIGLATAALLDAGVMDVRSHLFIAHAENIATLVLSKSPFSEEQLRTLNSAVQDLGFGVLLAPGRPPESPLLHAIIQCHDLTTLNRTLDSSYLDLTVPTDNRPFFFNQLRFSDIPNVALRLINEPLGSGVAKGNLFASAVLVLGFCISIIAVIATILCPLRRAARESARVLIVFGTLYFSLIGMGFMFAEIALVQRFSLFLGHPIYSLSVCLFSLILAAGLGSVASERLKLDACRKLIVWGSMVVVYLAGMEEVMPWILQFTADQERSVRIGVSVIQIMPLGFLLGFAFPTGIRLVEAVDRSPTPWFWGINGATGVIASVAGLMLSISVGINVTFLISAFCYFWIIPTSVVLLRLETMK
jgi:spermidine synthase